MEQCPYYRIESNRITEAATKGSAILRSLVYRIPLCTHPQARESDTGDDQRCDRTTGCNGDQCNCPLPCAGV